MSKVIRELCFQQQTNYTSLHSLHYTSFQFNKFGQKMSQAISPLASTKKTENSKILMSQLFNELRQIKLKLQIMENKNEILELKVNFVVKENVELRKIIEEKIMSGIDEVQQKNIKLDSRIDKEEPKDVLKQLTALNDETNSCTVLQNIQPHQFSSIFALQSIQQIHINSPKQQNPLFHPNYSPTSSNQSSSYQSSSDEQHPVYSILFNQAERMIDSSKRLKQIKQKTQEAYNDLEEVKETTSKNKLKFIQVDQKLNHLQKQQQEILNRYQQDLLAMQDHQNKLKQKIISLKQSQSPQSTTNSQTININQLTAHYAQSMFWLTNAYFLSFRIMRTEMFKQDKSPWQSKISTIFTNVKKVIGLITSVEVIKVGVEIVSMLMGIYMDEESGMFNEKMYLFLTENFFSEREINEAVGRAVLKLVEERFVERRICCDKQDEMKSLRNKGNLLMAKAKSWYETKKQNVMQSISGLKVQNRPYSKSKVDLLVIQDLAKIFAYIALNKINSKPYSICDKSTMQINSILSVKEQPQLLVVVFEKALIEDQMDQRLVNVYQCSKGYTESIKNNGNGVKIQYENSKKCNIY